MKESLKITIIQSHLYWENPEANRSMFSDKIASINDYTDIIILPEMFTSGFTMNAKKLAECTEGETLKWMQKLALKNDAAIVGSIIVCEANSYFNRLFFVQPDSSFFTYDKRHTFTLAGEHKIYKSGDKKLLVNYKGWKICPLICYDLRFPVWARNTSFYDVLIYTANWPKKRINAWDALLKARAIENMSYCIGVNRIGLDGNAHEYSGHSAGYNVLGDLITTPNFQQEFIETITLDKNHINTHRKHLQFLNDQDSFTLK